MAERSPWLATAAALLAGALALGGATLAIADDAPAADGKQGQQGGSDGKQAASTGDDKGGGGESSKAGPSGAGASGNGKAEQPKLTPEEKMARRFPQPVRVGYLIGLPVLDETNATVARVRSVVRTSGGKIQLVVPYGGLFGIGSRLVAVPVEVVAMLGRQVVAVDMPSASFETAPTYYGSGTEPVKADDVISVAVMRR